MFHQNQGLILHWLTHSQWIYNFYWLNYFIFLEEVLGNNKKIIGHISNLNVLVFPLIHFNGRIITICFKRNINALPVLYQPHICIISNRTLRSILYTKYESHEFLIFFGHYSVLNYRNLPGFVRDKMWATHPHLLFVLVLLAYR